MKPVYIYGPVAWFDADDGKYCVRVDDAFCFVSHTSLPIPLFVEHDERIYIGLVLKLQVEKDRLVAYCVVDDLLFLSVINTLRQCGDRYQALDIGTFLNILFPSLSSFHLEGSFKINEISLVDRGRRIGALWKVDDKVLGKQRSVTRRANISLEELKTKLLYLLLRQRQQTNRIEHLCRDAQVCGHSIEFVSASSLPLSPSKEKLSRMSQADNAKIVDAIMELSKRFLPKDSGKLHQNGAQEASEDPVYSYSDLKKMLLKLEKKNADSDELEHDVESLVKRIVAKQMAEMKTSRRPVVRMAKAVDVSISEDEDSEVEHEDKTYTSVPVGTRFRQMMKSNANSKKKSRKSRKRVVEESNDSCTDEETAQDADKVTKKKTKNETKTMLQHMNGRIDEMYEKLNVLASAEGAQQSAAQHSKNSQAQVSYSLSPESHTPRGEPNTKNSASVNVNTCPEVKCSGLTDNKQRDIIHEVFQ